MKIPNLEAGIQWKETKRRKKWYEIEPDYKKLAGKLRRIARIILVLSGLVGTYCIGGPAIIMGIRFDPIWFFLLLGVVALWIIMVFMFVSDIVAGIVFIVSGLGFFFYYFSFIPELFVNLLTCTDGCIWFVRAMISHFLFGSVFLGIGVGTGSLFIAAFEMERMGNNKEIRIK
ncbi:MAG: hypothetical protein ACTSRD_10375 [Promethearchaeota archaeon]